MKKSTRKQEKIKTEENDYFHNNYFDYQIDDESDKIEVKSKLKDKNDKYKVHPISTYDTILQDYRNEFEFFGFKPKVIKHSLYNYIEASNGLVDKFKYYNSNCPVKIVDGIFVNQGIFNSELEKHKISEAKVKSLKERDLLYWKLPVNNKNKILKIMKKYLTIVLNDSLYSKVIKNNCLITSIVKDTSILQKFEMKEEKHLSYNKLIFTKFEKFNQVLKSINSANVFNFQHVFDAISNVLSFENMYGLIYLTNKNFKQGDSAICDDLELYKCFIKTKEIIQFYSQFYTNNRVKQNLLDININMLDTIQFKNLGLNDYFFYLLHGMCFYKIKYPFVMFKDYIFIKNKTLVTPINNAEFIHKKRISSFSNQSHIQLPDNMNKSTIELNNKVKESHYNSKKKLKNSKSASLPIENKKTVKNLIEDLYHHSFFTDNMKDAVTKKADRKKFFIMEDEILNIILNSDSNNMNIFHIDKLENLVNKMSIESPQKVMFQIIPEHNLELKE